MLTIIIVVVLCLALFGTLPVWNWNSTRGWGYGPSGIVGAILVVILLLWATGHRL